MRPAARESPQVTPPHTSGRTPARHDTVTTTRWPLVQAPMAGAQDAGLAAAVAGCGALGSLPAAMLDAAGLAAELARFRALQPQAPCNVNFFAHTPPLPDPAREARWRERLAPYYAELGLDLALVPPAAPRQPFSDALAEVLEAAPPAVVSFHFGLPAPPLLARVRRLGCRIWSSATTVAEARWLASQGVDAVIAQGLEAGGHRGHFLSDDLGEQCGTLALLPQVVAAVDLPVIAAGGVADAAGVRAALALGASGVQVGTAYLCCHEARTSARHRAALLQPQAGASSRLTHLFTGRPARGLMNRLMRELGPLADGPPAFPLASGALAPLRAAAEAAGRDDFTPLWSGQNTSGCQPVGAAELTRRLLAGFAPH